MKYMSESIAHLFIERRAKQINQFDHIQWKLIITLCLGSMKSLQSDRDIAKPHYKRRVLYDTVIYSSGSHALTVMYPKPHYIQQRYNELPLYMQSSVLR